MTIFKALFFTVFVVGTVAVLFPYRILKLSRNLALPGAGFLEYVAALLMLTGVAIYAWCSKEIELAGWGRSAPMEPPELLVVRGLYRHTRNPMYVGLLTLLAGEALLFRSGPLLLYALAMFSGFHVLVVAHEERRLARTFGAAYEDYRASVPRWLFRLRRPLVTPR